jgi:predicted ATPase
VIRSIEIKGLRGIREGRLDDLTPLVVLVGPNGSGKSTVLDALLIGASLVPGDAVGRTVVRRRLGVGRGARWLLWRASEQSVSEIKVVTDQGNSRHCILRLDPTSLELEDETATMCEVTDTGGAGAQPGSSITLRTNFSSGDRYNSSRNILPLPGVTEARIIEAHAVNLQTPLHQLYTRTVEQGRRKEAREIIASVIPGVVGMEILTEGNIPIVYLVYDDHSVPVGLAGDGAQSLLRLSLELASRHGGLVLLEEPEVHQHPGAIQQSARAILAAIRREIQVILTTHSLELIDALVAEARDDAELDRLSVYRVQLQAGHLQSSRVSGPDVAFARVEIGDDLR